MGAIDTYPPQNVSAQTPVLAFASSTTTQSGVSTEQDVTGCVVSVTVPAGRRIRITGRIEVGTPSVNNNVFLLIREVTAGNAEVGRGAVVLNTSTESTLTAIATLTPSTGFHTYKLTLQTNTGTINTTNLSSAPNYILVEDITGSQLPVLPQSVPVGQLGYAEVTTTQSGVTSEVALTGASTNVSVPAGRQLRISAQCFASSTVANDLIRIKILQDGVQIQSIDYLCHTANTDESITSSTIESPSAGAHVYSLNISRASGSGTVRNTASAAVPTYILVEDISPTPAPGQGAPSSVLAFASIGTPTGTLGPAESDIPGLSVNITVPAGRLIKVTGYAHARSSVSTDTVYVRVMEDASPRNFAYVNELGATPGTGVVTDVWSPTAGMHTIKLRVARQAGSGNVNVYASAPLEPSYILVEDITGAIWPVGSTVTSGLIASEPWSTWTPSVTQGVAVTSTIATARYIKMGRVVHCYMRINITSSGTSGQSVVVSLPVPAFAHGGSGIPVGSGWIYDSSTTTMYEGSWGMSSAGLTVDMASDATGGNDWGIVPAIGLASGDIIAFHLTYEAAS